MAWFSTGSSTVIHSLTPLGLPGRLIISVLPRVTATLREPSADELAARAKISVAMPHAVLNAVRRTYSLNMLVGDDEATLADFLTAEHEAGHETSLCSLPLTLAPNVQFSGGVDG
jgi:hypothetical protein